ncbi:hypothetical protein OSTOST_03834 [Ostertagia ostertagi]
MISAVMDGAVLSIPQQSLRSPYQSQAPNLRLTIEAINEHAGLGTEVYMTPQPNSAKTGGQQLDEMYNNLRNSNINVQSIWIQVTSPVNWYVTSTLNINFINSILTRANVLEHIRQWSIANETPANFSDFLSFAGWTSPSVKQFAQVESVCGITVNRDIYSTSSAAVAGMARREKGDQQIIASTAYAVDLLIPISLAGFQCIRSNQYSTAFIRAYTHVGQGQIDEYAVSNIQLAIAAGLGAEAYMSPQPQSSKTGAQQFDEMYLNLINSNIDVQSVWIQHYGLSVGIYTNIDEWSEITGSAKINNAMLRGAEVTEIY